MAEQVEADEEEAVVHNRPAERVATVATALMAVERQVAVTLEVVVQVVAVTVVAVMVAVVTAEVTWETEMTEAAARVVVGWVADLAVVALVMAVLVVVVGARVVDFVAGGMAAMVEDAADLVAAPLVAAELQSL